ncbi:LacI family DNA-binding transcriptional regulator [Microbacterium sp. B2969]|uniref:LacI family DNA-binding transcriptional regulator n=1 Tax=Microbacterium alkaliflavum TaxID=3248839 RepID=A0ABW7Q9C1_9MICO
MTQGSGSGKSRPSIYDVAQVAGVSHMTVSRVINGYPHIKDGTRQRVLHAMIEIGYLPRGASRQLESEDRLRIGVIVDGAEQYGPRSTLQAIERAARDLGHVMTAYSVPGFRSGAVDLGLAELRDHAVDALCLVAPRFSSLGAVAKGPLWVPAVVVGDDDSQSAITTVAVDQAKGARTAVDHLVALGHRSILHLAGPLNWVDALARERAWRQTMDGHGLRPNLLIGDWTSDVGFTVGAEHPLIEEVTAVFASNDQMALGLLHGVKSRGLRVPDDISIVGYDDSPEARHFAPPLTSVNQNFDRLGHEIIRVVHGLIEGRPTPDRVRVDAELIMRQSVAPVGG